jgi:aldose sugar dehydrogenase
VTPARRPLAGPFIAAAALLTILVGVGVRAGAAGPPAAPAPTPTLTEREKKQLPTATPLPRPVNPPDAPSPRSSVYLDGLKTPVGLVFAPDGRLFFSEVFTGNVRVAERVGDRGRLLERPFVSLEIAKGAEAGVLGLALDPDFEHNRWVYLYYSEPDPDRRDRVPKRNRLVRYTEQGNLGTEVTVILDDIDIAREGRHNGGRLLFGPDGKLYVTVGNAQDRSHSQDMNRPNGKVLRINPDGSIPDDNPFAGSPIYALGFRNPFGLAIQPGTGSVWVTENGGVSNDEVNLVRPGGNYGFPTYEGIGNDPRFVDPVWESGSQTIGPTGLTFYTGDQLPQYRGDLFFCAINTGILTRLRLTGPAGDHAEAAEDVTRDCRLDVTNGPDGALYYASLDQILRLGR